VPQDLESSVRRPIRSAAVAVVFVAAAFVLTLILQRVALRAYFMLFVPAVMFSTWVGGRGSGMVASALTVVAATYLLPRTELVDQFAWLVVAAIVTFGTSLMTDARRRAEAVLTAQAKEESARRRDAESLSQLKTDVLAQVAHELRQPLSAVTAAVGLLQVEGSESARQRAVATIARQTNHLRLLIDDLLDLSRMARQQLQLHESDIDLCEVVDDSLSVIAAEIAARRIDLSTTIPPCPVHLTADPTRMRQILSNLLSNAVKFTPEGGKIDLALEQTPGQVVLRVRDNGRGIPPDHLRDIFDMFHKGEGDSTGLGVGLAVAKGLAEMHGGSVEAHSDGPGSGSEFIVRLPVWRGANRERGVAPRVGES
jgi:signal transduction histidine kinase